MVVRKQTDILREKPAIERGVQGLEHQVRDRATELLCRGVNLWVIQATLIRA